MAFINQVMDRIVQGVGSLFWKDQTRVTSKSVRKSTDPKSILKIRKTQSLKKVSFGPDQIIYRYNHNVEEEPPKNPHRNTELDQQMDQPQASGLEMQQLEAPSPTHQPLFLPPLFSPPLEPLPLPFIAPESPPHSPPPPKSKYKLKLKPQSANPTRIPKRDAIEQDRLFSLRRVCLEDDCVFCGEGFSDARLACAHTAHIRCFYRRGLVLCRACESKNLL